MTGHPPGCGQEVFEPAAALGAQRGPMLGKVPGRLIVTFCPRALLSCGGRSPRGRFSSRVRARSSISTVRADRESTRPTSRRRLSLPSAGSGTASSVLPRWYRRAPHATADAGTSSAAMTCSIFIASITASCAPRRTAAPSSTASDTIVPCSGALTASMPSGSVSAGGWLASTTAPACP